MDTLNRPVRHRLVGGCPQRQVRHLHLEQGAAPLAAVAGEARHGIT